MKYELEFAEECVDFVKAQNAKNAKLIKQKLLDLENGNFHKDKALKGKFGGLWRKRAGDFRIIYKRENNQILILILKIARRGDIYDD